MSLPGPLAPQKTNTWEREPRNSAQCLKKESRKQSSSVMAIVTGNEAGSTNADQAALSQE